MMVTKTRLRRQRIVRAHGKNPGPLAWSDASIPAGGPTIGGLTGFRTANEDRAVTRQLGQRGLRPTIRQRLGIWFGRSIDGLGFGLMLLVALAVAIATAE